MTGPIESVPEQLFAIMLPEGPDDDVAILVAWVDPPGEDEGLSSRLDPVESAVAKARHLVTAYLQERGMPPSLVSDDSMVPSELVTNAVVHAPPPLDLSARIEGHDLF